MRPTISIIVLAIVSLLVGCKEKLSPTQRLYNEVMSIHDEVMPKMDDIHRKKISLREKLARHPEMAAEEKARDSAMIAKLDSAGESMMVWMREFDPLPDSTGEEKARAYLEKEKVRITQVRDNIENALKEAEAY